MARHVLVISPLPFAGRLKLSLAVIMGLDRPSLKPIPVLIADHDRSAIKAIQSCLVPAGYECEAVESGYLVFERLRHQHYPLVLCALQLPDSDGVEVLRQALEIAPQTAYLMMGTPVDWGLAIEAMRIGAWDFLEKPFRPRTWCRSIERAFEHHQSKADQETFHLLLEQTLQERTNHLHQALEQVEENQRCTLETLVMTLDAREHETHLHSLRVEAFTLLLAEKCGYSSALMKELRQASLLHDIGKIVVPDSILLKPSRLTPEEFRVMQTHTTHGFRILSRIPHLQRAAMVAHCHHERVDGKGYPQGLQGGEIPVEARIFAVADTLDVITAGRPYRAARSLAEARVEILQHAGTQFDSDVVDVFLTVGDEVWQTVRDRVALQYPSPSQPLAARSASHIVAY